MHCKRRLRRSRVLFIMNYTHMLNVKGKPLSASHCLRKPDQATRSSGVSHSAILKRLLSDISALTKVPLEVPCEDGDAWALTLGPAIDKQLLKFLEEIGDKPILFEELKLLFPVGLHPLVESFCNGDLKSLKHIRQLLLFGYKTEQQSTKDQNEEAFKGFLDSEQSIEVWRSWFLNHGRHDNDVLFNEARKIISRITAGCDFRNVTGHHGPGSCYPPRFPDRKSQFTTYYDPIREYYGYSELYHCLPSFWDYIGTSLDRIHSVEGSIVAKITAVPKDSRGPRLICVHPSESIWLQLGQSDVLCKAIESHPLSRGRVSFRDQTLNGTLALQSSSDRAFCTIDLKEASDRVDCELVRYLFGNYQYDLLSCSRASSYIGLDGVLRVMNKWAPMGNGLTFPVESLVFFALATAGIKCRYGVNCNDVYVFGDDIIIPNHYFDGVCSAFTRAGLIINSSKTFRRGFFRESCGVEAFKGHDVTPIRVKKGVRNVSITDGVSLCSLAMRLRKQGYYRTSAYIYAQVAKRNGPLPISNNPDYSAIYEYVDCRLDDLLWSKFGTRWFSNLQLHGIKARSVLARTSRRVKDEWFHLQDSLLRLTPHRGIDYSKVFDVDRGDPKRLPISMKTSDRGLVYPAPFGVRSYDGVVPHLWK